MQGTWGGGGGGGGLKSIFIADLFPLTVPPRYREQFESHHAVTRYYYYYRGGSEQ